MQIDIVNIKGESTGRSVTLPDDIFGIEPNEHAMYLAVKQYLANQRQGTHKAKERSEIKGSTRKIKRQKGTGTARAGDIKNPLFRGGGRVFGPRPRTYGVKLNKKVKRLARLSALATVVKDGQLKVVEDIQMDAPKTGALAQILNDLGAKNYKSLLVVGEVENNLMLSSRNLKKANVRRYQDLNTYEILNAGTMLVSESAVDGLVAMARGQYSKTANA